MDNGLELSGKVAIVTGAGSEGNERRNGESIALTLAKAGASVCVVDLMKSRAEKTVRQICDAGGIAIAVQADVSNEVNCEQVVKVTRETFGCVHILINNVGIMGPPGTVVTVDPEEWVHAMRINVLSVVIMSKFAIPLIADVGGGAVVNIGSTAGLFGGHAAAFYPTSKAAVVHLSKVMAVHHGPQKIRVNCVTPGLVYSPMVKESGVDQKARELRKERSLLNEEGRPWDVAAAVKYLVSDEAKWVTGVVFPVDGGLTAAIK